MKQNSSIAYPISFVASTLSLKSSFIFSPISSSDFMQRQIRTRNISAQWYSVNPSYSKFIDWRSCIYFTYYRNSKYLVWWLKNWQHSCNVDIMDLTIYACTVGQEVRNRYVEHIPLLHFNWINLKHVVAESTWLSNENQGCFRIVQWYHYL